MKATKKPLKTPAEHRPPKKTSGEEVAIYAYTLWELEGRPPGRDLAHWLQAEILLQGGHQPDAPRA